MKIKFLFILVSIYILTITLTAQNQLAATLEVLEGGVTVLRVNTQNPIEVKQEAIVGVGDVIRTNDKGRARITFFADGTETTLLPNTEYRIVQFEGNDTQFNLTVEVLLGQTVQRLNRLVDANSSYSIQTPGMTLAARGTAFNVRVQPEGSSAMIVTEGLVNASSGESEADVPLEFGIRADNTQQLSDVVKAKTFEELDSSLDGCAATVATSDDVLINVRLSPSTQAPRLGGINANEVTRFYGKSQASGWYRIEFGGNYGWILSSSATIGDGCVMLREFEATYTEDASLFEGITVPPSTPMPEATESAGS